MRDKLDARTKWSYCIGATGRDAAYALVSMYLILYVQYTMNLTSAQFAMISGAMILCMVWDAINDLLMGIIIENTHFKMGKFKPWILAGSLTNAIVIVCLFTIRPSGWGFVAFYSLFYLLWGMTYTMNDIAYWGVLPSLSSDPGTRDSLVTIMSIFVCIGQFSVAGVVPVVIAGNAVKAYRIVAVVVALCLIAFQMLTAFGIKENDREEQKDKLSLKDMYLIFMRNDQLVAAGIASIFFNITCNILIIFGVNFFYIEYGYSESGNLVFYFTVMYGLGMLISQASYATLAKHFTRQKMLNVCFAALLIGYACFMGFGYVLPKNVVLLNNAIEACEQCEKPIIKMKFVKEEHQIVLSVANTFSVTPVIVGKRYITTKTKEADRHGIGLENIKETVGKYDGSCVIKHDDDNFKVAILIHNQEK